MGGVTKKQEERAEADVGRRDFGVQGSSSSRRAMKQLKKRSQQCREAVNEGVMKLYRWEQVIYNE